MDRLIVFSFFAFILAATIESQTLEKAAAAFRKCSANLSPGDKTAVTTGQGTPSSPAVKCFIACMMKEENLISGGQYNKDQALKAIDVFLKDNPSEAAKAKNVVEICAKEVGTDVGPDECGFAGRMTICNINNAIKMGAKPANVNIAIINVPAYKNI